MMRWTIPLFACTALCWISTPSQSAEISGAWQIDTEGGPTPLCTLVQAGNSLTGSCVEPLAKGTVTGAVVGSTIRWRWQSAAAFDFVGTVGPDNTIAGVIERREIGLSLKFTAQKQIVSAAPQPDMPQPQQTSTGGYSNTLTRTAVQQTNSALGDIQRQRDGQAPTPGIDRKTVDAADADAKRLQEAYGFATPKDPNKLGADIANKVDQYDKSYKDGMEMIEQAYGPWSNQAKEKALAKLAFHQHWMENKAMIAAARAASR